MSKQVVSLMLVVSVLIPLTGTQVEGAAARRESVLVWDQADSVGCLTCFAGHNQQRLVVGFDAPPWARSVTRMEVFIVDDCIPWPQPSPPPTTLPFNVYVWAPSSTNPCEPGEIASVPVNPGTDYPDAAWLELSFPGGASIDDPAVFPDGRFYVGVQWLHRLNPCIGLDVSQPDEMTQWHDWYVWSTVTDGDAMIRAVVSDDAGAGSEVSSWARVKALFR